MDDSNFWYQYSTAGPRGQEKGQGGKSPLGPPSDPPMTNPLASLMSYKRKIKHGGPSLIGRKHYTWILLLHGIHTNSYKCLWLHRRKNECN